MKKHKKNLSKLLGILFISVLSSCTTIPIPDEQICVDMGETAFCTTTLSQRDHTYFENEWPEKRIGRLSMSAKSWGEIEKTIRKACKAAGNRCVDDIKKTTKTIKRLLNEKHKKDNSKSF